MSCLVRRWVTLLALMIVTYGVLLAIQWVAVAPSSDGRMQAEAGTGTVQSGRSVGYRLRDEAALLSGSK